MLYLIKYEILKQRTSKLILAGFLLFSELAFLVGALLKHDTVLGLGVLGLAFTGLAGLLIVGLETIITYYGDMKNKRGYMLFMTPHSVYTILTSKILTGILAIVIWCVMICILAFLDLTVLAAAYSNLSEVLRAVQQGLGQFSIDINWTNTLLITGEIIFSWISMVASAFLAITISMSLMSGVKAKGIISFVLYFILNGIAVRVSSLLIDLFVSDSMRNIGFLSTGITFAVTVVFTVLCIFGTGEILKRRLSL